MLDSSTNWKLWCTDKFGRSNDVYVSAEGTSIEEGLRKLWARELDGGYYPQGGRSWMYYRLDFTDTETSGSILTFENKDVLVKLIRWAKVDLDAVVNKISEKHLEELRDNPPGIGQAAQSDACRVLLEKLESVQSLDELLLT